MSPDANNKSSPDTPNKQDIKNKRINNANSNNGDENLSAIEEEEPDEGS